MGFEAAKHGRQDDARTLFEDAVRLDPHAWDAWGALIRVELESERLDDARQALDQAQAAGMPAAPLHAYRGTLAAVNGDRATATRELNAAETAGAVSDPVLRDVIAKARAMLSSP
jgi:Flp pilus assembly protein TadD